MTKRQAKIDALHALADIAATRSNNPKDYGQKQNDAYRQIGGELRNKALGLQATEDRFNANKGLTSTHKDFVKAK